jgi:hypothetical protein
MLMIRNGIPKVLQDTIASPKDIMMFSKEDVQHLAASVGEVIVEIPDNDLQYTMLGRVGVELPSKALLESTNEDRIPEPV